jgi:hypothetical protein
LQATFESRPEEVEAKKVGSQKKMAAKPSQAAKHMYKLLYMLFLSLKEKKMIFIYNSY